MKTSTIETLVWVLIYGGLLGLGLGLAVQRYHAPLGWGIAVTGAVVATVGVVLIYVRSRMKSPT
jgi:lysozyme family protein